MSKYQGTEKERQQARDRMQRMRERRAVTGVTGVKSMGVTSPEDKLEVLYLIEGYAPAIVCAVNGFYIRNHVYIDFTEGGNDQVYGGGPNSEANFIDPGIIYLDDDVNAIEKKFVLLHELHERNKMKNEGWSYDKAHEDANRVEQMARDNPELVDGLIEIELQDWR